MPFGSLWLPVLVSAIVVFFASAVMHMVLKYHRADHRQLPAEESVRDVIARAAPSPGVYFTPYCRDHAQVNEPGTKEKFEKGPVAIVTVLPNGAPMLPKHLAIWFGLCLAISFTAAYVARHTLQAGAPGLLVMQVTGSVAFAAYALSQIDDSIWKGQPWANTMRLFFDGLVYSLLTALVFRFLWPAA